MSYVVINAITVPRAQADTLAARFAGRAGMVESADGFKRFELLRPADDRDQWLVMTTWRDKAAFEAWLNSAAFGRAHGGAATGAEHPGGQHPSGHHPAGHHPGGQPAPVATANEIWAFTVEQRSAAGS